MSKFSSDHRLRLVQTKNGRVFVQFYIHGKRFRYSNGEALGLGIYPNRCSGISRQGRMAELLAAYHDALVSGWSPSHDAVQRQTLVELIEGVQFAQCQTLKYRKALELSRRKFLGFLIQRNVVDPQALTARDLRQHLKSVTTTPSTFNHERKRLSVILNLALRDHDFVSPMASVAKQKETQCLHQPFEDVQAVLNEIREFNENLWLCCLLTYGCLLRPHQEVRQLTWGDLSEDMSFISLSGERNKSGRNRIVPLNPQIAVCLLKGEYTANIFTGTEKPYNADYFKTLWSRYSKHSKLLKPNQTLYSFRHTGAIEIFKRTGSLTTLQRAMGHADLKTTLGYLRNLEVPMLKVEDMPMFGA